MNKTAAPAEVAAESPSWRRTASGIEDRAGDFEARGAVRRDLSLIPGAAEFERLPAWWISPGGAGSSPALKRRDKGRAELGRKCSSFAALA